MLWTQLRRFVCFVYVCMNECMYLSQDLYRRVPSSLRGHKCAGSYTYTSMYVCICVELYRVPPPCHGYTCAGSHTYTCMYYVCIYVGSISRAPTMLWIHLRRFVCFVYVCMCERMYLSQDLYRRVPRIHLRRFVCVCVLCVCVCMCECMYL